MRTVSAVLRDVKGLRPYTVSEPIGMEVLELTEPRAGEVRVRIEAAGVCHSDLSVVNGDRVRPLPMALGHEAAGIVDALGEGVEDLDIGDHVVMVYVPSCGECEFCSSGQPALCKPGSVANTTGELLAGGRRLNRAGEPINHHLGVSSFSQFAVVHRSSAVKVPKAVPFDVAALFGCAMATGYGAVARTAGVRPGESVVIFGLGGVGLSAVIAAQAMEAGQIIAVDPVASKLQRALELGASIATTPDKARRAVIDSLGSGGDWVFEAVGSAQVLEQAYDLTKPGGTTVSMGLPHPDATLSIPALSVVAESRTVKGSYMGSTRPHEDIPAMAELWQEGKLPVEKLISSHRSLAELNEALEALADGTAIRQIVLPQNEEVSL